jgi:hypothetical protein
MASPRNVETRCLTNCACVARLRWVLLTVLLVAPAWCQRAPEVSDAEKKESSDQQWFFEIDAAGNFIPNDESFFSATFTADHKCLHMEARYAYEDLRTGSLWAGCTFTLGKRVTWGITPMFGGIFGRTNGVAPGYETELTYKKLRLWSEGEYLVSSEGKTGNFFYSWSEVVYAPRKWIHGGFAVERTIAYNTPQDVQRGFSIGFAPGRWDFTTYVLNLGTSRPVVIVNAGYKF